MNRHSVKVVENSEDHYCDCCGSNADVKIEVYIDDILKETFETDNHLYMSNNWNGTYDVVYLKILNHLGYKIKIFENGIEKLLLAENYDDYEQYIFSVLIEDWLILNNKQRSIIEIYIEDGLFDNTDKYKEPLHVKCISNNDTIYEWEANKSDINFGGFNADNFLLELIKKVSNYQ